MASLPSPSSTSRDCTFSRKAPQEGGRQWLFGLCHWELRTSAFRTKCDLWAGTRTEPKKKRAPRLHLSGLQMDARDWGGGWLKEKRKVEEYSSIDKKRPGALSFGILCPWEDLLGQLLKVCRLGNKTWNQRVNSKVQHYWKFALWGHNGKGRFLAFSFRVCLGPLFLARGATGKISGPSGSGPKGSL